MFDEKMLLRDVVATLIARASETNRMDQTVLLLLVYLCDWHSCVKYGRRFTDVTWRVSKHGLADDGLETYIRTHQAEFQYDNIAEMVISKVKAPSETSEWSAAVIDRVCALYKEKMRSGLATFAMSTYPILSSSSEILEPIDLLQKSREYLEIKDGE